METDILIIGAGLCGLALGRALQRQGRDFEIAEARSRVGGRIATMTRAGADFDLGPAWFWPDHLRMMQLVTELGLEKFDQFAQGIQTFEDQQGTVSRSGPDASMQGSWRLTGGLARLTEALATGLNPKLDAQVTTLAMDGGRITATCQTGTAIHANTVVLALPPRLAAQIRFDPGLPDATRAALRDIPTWMAGQAKAMAIYDRPFWRDAGLSGDAMSRRGPLVEIHDASPHSSGPYALFGFIGTAPQNRQNTAALRNGITAQLGRLFGHQAAQPTDLQIKDWAFDRHTATRDDLAPLYAHPPYGMPTELTGLWNNRLIFSGSETANQFGGYLEGALEAAARDLPR